MKAAAFDYLAPSSLEEALAALAEHGDEAKPIAGGQSLVPLLALRFAQPSVLVDLNGIAALAGVRELPDGSTAIGAMTRTRALEEEPAIAARVPLAAAAAPHIAHRAIRNRGTVGGSIAHADAAAELPALMLALGARIVARGPGGEREIPAEEFFLSHYMTTLAADELITELRLAPPDPGAGVSFLEISRRQGDFAIVGVAATVTPREERCAAARVALLGVADRPVGLDTAPLIGELLERRRLEAFATAATAELSPSSDQHASAEYRRHLAAVLVRRALEEAAVQTD